MPVPAIIERETFDQVQALLQARNPKTELPARVVIGPTLLTGICYCGNCGGAMTIRTGKSGRYRYYACSIKARQGETGCKGRAIPMDKLDTNLPHFKNRLNSLSKSLYLEHGWNLPDGYKENGWKNPLNFTLAEWQQAMQPG